MDGTHNLPIERLVESFKKKSLSRQGFVTALAGVGASAVGIATFLSAADGAAAAGAAPGSQHTPGSGHTGHTTQHHNKTLHHAHVQRRNKLHQTPVDTHPAALDGVAPAAMDAAAPAAGAQALSEKHMQMLREIVDDYADDAVVEDPLFVEPFVGKAAIMQRKMAEMSSMRGLTLDVTHRFAHHDQVVAEWVARGTIHGQFLGLNGNGRPIEMHGVTVVTRAGGKIVKETLYYDLATLRQQLNG